MPQQFKRALVPARRPEPPELDAIHPADEEEQVRGIDDGLEPAVVDQEETVNHALTNRQLADFDAIVSIERAELETTGKHLNAQMEKEESADPHLDASPLLRGSFWTTLCFLLLMGEIWIVKAVTGAFAPGEFGRLLVALCFVVGTGAAMKIAISPYHPTESVLARPPTRWALAALAASCGGALVWFREVHYAVEVAEQSGMLARIMAAAVSPATLTIGTFTALLIVLSAFAMERAKFYFRLHCANRRANKLQRRIDANEKRLAVLKERDRCGRKQIEAGSEVRHAVYRRGVLKARAEKPKQSLWTSVLQALRRPALMALCALGLVLVALLSSCGLVPERPTQGVAILLDESSSIAQLTPEQRLRVVMTALSRVSCATVKVIPVNATIREPYEVTLPCEDRDGYGDEFKAAYKRAEEELRSRFLQWAKDSNGSDYGGALDLASRFLAHFETKQLIIIGDLKQSGGNGEFRVVKGVPSLGDAKFFGAKVYVGFIESRGTGRAATPFRAAWTKAFQAAGVLESDITNTPFGLEELKLWCDTNIGSVNPAYEKYEASRK